MIAENTFEYWVLQASKGKNIAICCQNCNRIKKEELLKLLAIQDKQYLKKEEKFYNQEFKNLIAEIQKESKRPHEELMEDTADVDSYRLGLEIAINIIKKYVR